jgi:DNA-binding transcriptional regulator YiaG
MTRQEFQAWRLVLGLKESDVAQMFGHTEQEIKNFESGRTAVPGKMDQHVVTRWQS